MGLLDSIGNVIAGGTARPHQSGLSVSCSISDTEITEGESTTVLINASNTTIADLTIEGDVLLDGVSHGTFQFDVSGGGGHTEQVEISPSSGTYQVEVNYDTV